VPVIGETIMPWDILGGIPIPPEHRDRIIKSLYAAEVPTPWESTAHHEAGHVVAAVTLNIKFRCVMMSNHVFVDKQESNLGGVVFDEGLPFRLADFDPGDPVHRQVAENWVLLALAGEASQSFMEARECDILLPSAEGDHEVVVTCATLLHADPSARDAFIESQKLAACNFVREPLREHQIRAVATNLQVTRQLAYADVCKIMEDIKAALENSDD
jgi:hypothetical protein